MGRRIVTSRLQSTGASPLDGYGARVVKYVPADVIAAWVAIGGLLGGGDRGVLLWVLFAVVAVLTPLWTLRMTREEGLPPAWFQAGMSVVAFAVWAYATGEPFTSSGLHDPALGGVALVLFTLLSGLVDPEQVPAAA